MTRLTDPGFDPRIADWLEADPVIAPPDLLMVVESALPSIPQRRAWRLPWRFPSMNRFAVVAAVVALAAVAGLGVLAVGGRPATPAPVPSTAPSPTPTDAASPVPSPPPSAASRVDYADVPGRLLVQHLGNALDGSEKDATDGNFDKRRFYLMNSDGSGMSELSPGQPASGKNHADISPDLTKVVFNDSPADGPSRIYEVGLDGTGLRTISTACDCSEIEPAYSPDGKKIAFTRIVGDAGQIGVRDLTTGKVKLFPETEGVVPAGAPGDGTEHASWAPDGSTIVYALLHVDASGSLVSSKLKLLDVASGTVTDLGVPEALGAGEPRYRPDGSVILFASRSAETTLGSSSGDIYTVRPDGSDLRRLTGNGDGDPACANGTGASWTPDGGHIVYMCNWIFLMDPDGSNKARWSAAGPDLSETATGYGYTTYWIPPAP